MALADIVAGRKIYAEELREAFDEIDATSSWVAYTPTWSTSGVAPAVGNGSITGKYMRKNHLLMVYALLIMGSTTTYGTGTWRISLPSGYASAQNYQVGSLYMLDSGTAQKAGAVLTHTDGDKVELISSAAAVTATSPHTWANGDYLSLFIALEIS